MLKQLDSTVKEASEKLSKLGEHIEDSVDELADESQQLWQRCKRQLEQLKARLIEASHHIETNTDEALLQAHLAAMDAGDHWQELKHHLRDLGLSAKQKTQPVIDHSALQAHLATMEARDFMSESAHKVTEQYKHSKATATQAAVKAAQEIKQQCEELINKIK